MMTSTIVLSLSVIVSATQSYAEELTESSSVAVTSVALYGTTLGFAAWTGAVRLLNPEPRYGFKKGLLFDDSVRNLLRLNDEQARETVSEISDILQATLVTQPFVQAGYLYLTKEITATQAWSRALIGLHSFALSTAIIFSTKTFVGRVRPKTRDCTPGIDEVRCASAPLRMSFISGHTTAAFTGAGLMCASPDEGRVQTLYEKLGCPVALGLATTTGLFRILSDNHYATDVLAGAIAGTLSGWLIPHLIYAAQSGRQETESTLFEADSRFPGTAELTTVLTYQDQSAQKELMPGARIRISQYLFGPDSNSLGGLLGLDARIERGSNDIQGQRATLRAGLSYQAWELYGLTRWYGQQESLFEEIRFGSGLGSMFGHQVSRWLRFNYGLDFILTSERDVIGGFDFFISLGRWFHSYLRLEKEFIADSSVQSATFGIGGHLNWGRW